MYQVKADSQKKGFRELQIVAMLTSAGGAMTRGEMQRVMGFRDVAVRDVLVPALHRLMVRGLVMKAVEGETGMDKLTFSEGLARYRCMANNPRASVCYVLKEI